MPGPTPRPTITNGWSGDLTMGFTLYIDGESIVGIHHPSNAYGWYLYRFGACMVDHPFGDVWKAQEELQAIFIGE